MITIIDYKMGNTTSIKNAFSYLGHEVEITDDISRIKRADRLVLPGVGSYRKAMKNIRELCLEEVIRQRVDEGCPILGICLGMQLMAIDSPEDVIDGVTKGFGFLPAHVLRFENNENYPTPHIGFNNVRICSAGQDMFCGIEDNSDFYFVHNYRIVKCDSKLVSGCTDYNGDFVSAFAYKNVWGTQFHPEKSQSNGLILLKNFATKSF